MMFAYLHSSRSASDEASRLLGRYNNPGQSFLAPEYSPIEAAIQDSQSLNGDSGTSPHVEVPPLPSSPSTPGTTESRKQQEASTEQIHSTQKLGSRHLSANAIIQTPTLTGLDEGYKTIDYIERSNIDTPLEEFYTSLFDDEGQPSELFIRMADSLFLFLSDYTRNKSLRRVDGVDLAEHWRVLEGPEPRRRVHRASDHEFFCRAANVSFRIQTVDGHRCILLDRAAWLRVLVFEANGDPKRAHRMWKSRIAGYCLVDPKTGEKFPHDLPRTAFRTGPSPKVWRAYEVWRHWFDKLLQCNYGTAIPDPKTVTAYAAQPCGKPLSFTPGLTARYSPTRYDQRGHGADAKMYGSAFDEQGLPSDMFRRMVDALFSLIVSHSPSSKIEDVDHIEHKAYDHFLLENALCMREQMLLKRFLFAAVCKVKVHMEEVELLFLDKSQWLRLHVLEAKAMPDHALQYWEKIVILLGLRDPATGERFPMPLPCSFFPCDSDIAAIAQCAMFIHSLGNEQAPGLEASRVHETDRTTAGGTASSAPSERARSSNSSNRKDKAVDNPATDKKHIPAPCSRT